MNSGFSIVSAILLFVAYAAFFKSVSKSWLTIASCGTLLLSLSGLQYWHIEFLLNDVDLFAQTNYRFWLFIVPAMFYFFSRAILLPRSKNSPLLLLHFTPLLLIFVDRYEWAIPLIFIVGTGYSFWFANIIYSLRAQRKRFKIEMFFFGFFTILAVFVLMMGISIPYIDNSYFYYFYLMSIFKYCLMLKSSIYLPYICQILTSNLL